MKDKSQAWPDKIHWRAPEFIDKKKTFVWYFVVAVFFFVSLIGLFLLNNIAGVIIVVILFWVFLKTSKQHPKLVDYTVDSDGVNIGQRRIEYVDVDSFSLETIGTSLVIILDLRPPFALPVMLVIKKDKLEDVMELLVRSVPLNNNFSLLRWISHWLHY